MNNFIIFKFHFPSFLFYELIFLLFISIFIWKVFLFNYFHDTEHHSIYVCVMHVDLWSWTRIIYTHSSNFFLIIATYIQFCRKCQKFMAYNNFPTIFQQANKFWLSSRKKNHDFFSFSNSQIPLNFLGGHKSPSKAHNFLILLRTLSNGRTRHWHHPGPRVARAN